MSLSIKIEEAIGTIDGINTTFNVSQPYVANSVSVYINGLLVKETDLDGWIESNPALGEITLSEAPLVGDKVQVFYTFFEGSGSSLNVVEQIIDLTGQINNETLLIGSFKKEPELKGDIDAKNLLNCKLDLSEKELKGIIDSGAVIVGEITKEC